MAMVCNPIENNFNADPGSIIPREAPFDGRSPLKRGVIHTTLFHTVFYGSWQVPLPTQVMQVPGT